MQYNGAKTVFSKNGATTTGHPYVKKMKFRHRLYTLHEHKLKMDHRPNIKCKTTKLLEDNIGENLVALGYGDAFQIQYQRHNTGKK